MKIEMKAGNESTPGPLRTTTRREVVVEETTGLLVEPGDVDDLARAIERLGTDPELRGSMGAAGAALMRDGFDKRRQFHAFLRHFAHITAPAG